MNMKKFIKYTFITGMLIVLIHLLSFFTELLGAPRLPLIVGMSGAGLVGFSVLISHFYGVSIRKFFE